MSSRVAAVMAGNSMVSQKKRLVKKLHQVSALKIEVPDCLGSPSRNRTLSLPSHQKIPESKISTPEAPRLRCSSLREDILLLMSPLVLSPCRSPDMPSDTEEDILSNLSKEEASVESSSTRHSKTKEAPKTTLAFESVSLKKTAKTLNANKVIKKRNRGLNFKPGSIIGFLASVNKRTKAKT